MLQYDLYLGNELRTHVNSFVPILYIKIGPNTVFGTVCT